MTSEFTYNESELLKSRSDKGGYEHRAALCVAMTSSRDNDTPVQPQSERDMRNSGAKPSQAMGAVAWEPREGEIPVRLIRCQPFDDFPFEIRGVEDKLDFF